MHARVLLSDTYVVCPARARGCSVVRGNGVHAAEERGKGKKVRRFGRYLPTKKRYGGTVWQSSIIAERWFEVG